MNNTILKHMNLVGAFNTSENMSSSVGMIVPFPMENKKTWFQSPPTRNSTSMISLKPPFPSLKTPAIPPSLPRPGGTSRDDGTGPCSTSRAQRDRGERLHSDGSCLQPWKFTHNGPKNTWGIPKSWGCGIPQ